MSSDDSSYQTYQRGAHQIFMELDLDGLWMLRYDQTQQRRITNKLQKCFI